MSVFARPAEAAIVLAVMLGPVSLCALANPPLELDDTGQFIDSAAADDWVYESESHALPLESEPPHSFPDSDGPPAAKTYRPFMGWLGLRHSHTHGRNIGVGSPLVGTSWLNRPYYVGGHLGNLWLTREVQPTVSDDVDTFGGIFFGCDWDHYWGTELALNRATPELINSSAPDADRGDRLLTWNASAMYYPWGDSRLRPYWRWGIGATEIDYPTDAGSRRDETLWTFPIGMGLKYPIRRWLAGRVELTDHWACGNGGLATQHNLSLTLGLEWRFGAHPRSYWPWHPSRHIW